MDHDVHLTIGQVVRHAPATGGHGLEAALIDIAQDLLLRDLSVSGVIDELAFKGGTALRKLFAGAEGRFSTDLDFSVRNAEEEMEAVVDLLVEAIVDTRCGPFRYDVFRKRGKPYLTIESDLGAVEMLTCKLDVSPPPWLPTERRPWIHMPIHDHYGGPLPELHVIRIEENVAEKIARLNRVTPARDAYDLVWIMRNRRKLGRDLDLDLVRRLAVMKAWVDMHGLETARHRWSPAHAPRPLDVARWLRERDTEEFDDESIGLLTTPPPELAELARELSAGYEFLSDLTPEEQRLATCSGRDRTLLLRLLAELPDTQLPQGTCW